SRLNKSEHDSAQAHCRHQAARPICSRSGVTAAAFRNLPRGQNQDDQPEWEINEEYPSPRAVLDEPSTKHGTYRGCDGCESGPGANRASPFLLDEISADQSQATRDKQCAAYSLKTPGQNQLANIRRQTAPCRCQRE